MRKKAAKPEADKASDKKYLLRATGLQKVFDEGTFNVHVLRGVYLRVEAGERITGRSDGVVAVSNAGCSRETLEGLVADAVYLLVLCNDAVTGESDRRGMVVSVIVV